MSAAVAVVDGLLLSGGGDIVSLRYGQEPHPAGKYQDPVRDAMEAAALEHSLDRGIPILAICRGIQVLNVALGGTLIQDIPTQVQNPLLHYVRGAPEPVLVHTLTIEPDTLLARALGTTSTASNSWHHQAVARVAPGLRVNCRSADDVIEGIEAEDGRPILGIQCHPEDVAEDYPLFRKLFDWLVREAGAHAR